jgi:hypothetical protein
MRTLRKTDIESMERELRVLKNPDGILGGWGREERDPYPQEVYEYLCSINAFEGGFVEGMGYVKGNLYDRNDYVNPPTGSVVYSLGDLINSLFRSCSGTGSISSDIMYVFATPGHFATYYIQSSVTEFLLDIPQFHYLQDFPDFLPLFNTWNNDSNLNKIVKIESISKIDPDSDVKRYGFRISVRWENDTNPLNVVSHDFYY